MNTPREELGERVKRVRGDRTQRDFAEFLGFSKGYVSDIERGRSFPSIPFLVSLGVKCGTDLTWLLLGEERGKDPPPAGSVLLEPADDEQAAFAAVLESLWRLYIEGDEDIRAWVRVQLRRAFPELESGLDDTKKQQAAAAESA